jgi:hypothetical protein
LTLPALLRGEHGRDREVAVVEQSSSMRSVRSDVDLRHLVHEEDEVDAVSIEFAS